MRKRCPVCTKVFDYPSYEVDYVHDCSDMPRVTSLANEDVKRLGTWSDSDGSSSSQKVFLQHQGVIDKRSMSESRVDDDTRLPNFNVRGVATDIYRDRRRFTHVNTK